MRTLLYTEAPMVYEETADQVRELWNAGLIPDDLAAMAWWIVRHSADQLHRFQVSVLDPEAAIQLILA